MTQLNSRERYLARASKAYHEQFVSNLKGDHWVANAGKDYLTSHGIGSYQIAKKYGIGVVIEPLTGDDDFKGMLSIPYLTKNGVKAIKFRNLNGGKPKNLVHKGQTIRLYNVNQYFTKGKVIGIAEGESDAIAATEILGVPTVGVPGAEDWKARRKIWAPLFKNFSSILVFTDGDPVNPATGLRPGEELGKAIVESLTWRAKIIKCPEGEDVCSMVASGRIEELTKQFGDYDEDE